MKKYILLLLVFFLALPAHAQIITTIAGGDSLGIGDGGPATDCELLSPIAVALDAAGNYYITDRDDNRIRKVNTAGIITTIAGTGSGGFSGDNGPAVDAEIYKPYGIAIDAAGNIYFSDDFNNRIRKIDAAGIITTIAGNGVVGYNGDGIPATNAELKGLGGIAIDGSGNIYFADGFNYRIRMINTLGIISTVAGNGTGGYNGDNIAATDAELFTPNYVALDNSGNLYIADAANNRIRKVNTSGIITTIAGNGIYGFSGDNGPATASEVKPLTVTVDGNGNVYIGDSYNDVVRKINTSGIITTIAGNGITGYSGDGGPALLAEFNEPVGITIDNAGNIYIADPGNSRIRFIRSTLFVSQVNNYLDSIKLFPNPSTGKLNIDMLSTTEEQVKFTISNLTGDKIKEQIAVTNESIELELNVPDGIYFLTAITAKGIVSQKIIFRAESP